MVFDQKWWVISHETSTNTVEVVLQPGDEAYFVAKFVDPNTPFSWSLYERTIVDA